MNIIPFNFDAHAVRTIMVAGEPWFIASDVAHALGYSETSAATRTLDEDDKGLQIVQTLGGPQSLSVINESGLYALILGSRLEAARRFKRWISHEVLPSIRKTGAYGLPEAVRRYFDDLSGRLSEADKLIEHKTRNDYFRLDGRSAANRQNTVTKIAAQYGLDPRLVGHANRTSTTDAMAEIVGDPKAIEDRRRVRESLAAIERERAPKGRRRR